MLSDFCSRCATNSAASPALYANPRAAHRRRIYLHFARNAARAIFARLGALSNRRHFRQQSRRHLLNRRLFTAFWRLVSRRILFYVSKKYLICVLSSARQIRLHLGRIFFGRTKQIICRASSCGAFCLNSLEMWSFKARFTPPRSTFSAIHLGASQISFMWPKL